MFDGRILIFLKSDSFYLPSVKTPKMAANPLKKTEIRRYTTEVPAFRPFFQRYGWTLCYPKRHKFLCVSNVIKNAIYNSSSTQSRATIAANQMQSK